MTQRRFRLTGAVILTVLAAATGAAGTAYATATDRAGRAAAVECTGSPLPSTNLTAGLVRGGFAFTEGPTWVAAGGYLLFSDLRPGTGTQRVQPSSIWRFTPPATFERFIAESGSNGLAAAPDGTRVLAATHDQRTVSSFNLADRSRTVVAANYQGRRFNSPNDLTIAADGTVYFSDPNYQRGNRADEMGGVTGLYRVRNGQVELIDGTLNQPNGVALSPDGTSLYVGATGTNQVFRYAIGADGRIGPRTPFASFPTPDGVSIDCAGNLYWASFNDGLVRVFAPDGRQIGTIRAARNTTNVAFGGPDGRTLFITSGTPGGWGTAANFGIYSVRVGLPGNPY